MVDKVFEELVSDKSFIDTFNFIRSHAIRHDQQNIEMGAREIHNTYRSPGTGTTKKDKIKTVFALIKESKFKTQLVQMMS